MFSTILANLFIGTAKDKISSVTHGRAETSNIPNTALCLSDFIGAVQGNP